MGAASRHPRKSSTPVSMNASSYNEKYISCNGGYYRRSYQSGYDKLNDRNLLLVRSSGASSPKSWDIGVAILLESRAEAKGSKKRYTGEHIFV